MMDDEEVARVLEEVRAALRDTGFDPALLFAEGSDASRDERVVSNPRYELTRLLGELNFFFEARAVLSKEIMNTLDADEVIFMPDPSEPAGLSTKTETRLSQDALASDTETARRIRPVIERLLELARERN